MGGNFHQSKPNVGTFTVAYAPGRGYIVQSPDGKQVAGPFSDRNRALMTCDGRQRVADTAAKRGPRACMSCCEEFLSEGVHNRLCADCRQRGADTAPYRFMHPNRRSA
jgi:hypothetical protein